MSCRGVSCGQEVHAHPVRDGLPVPALLVLLVHQPPHLFQHRERRIRIVVLRIVLHNADRLAYRFSLILLERSAADDERRREDQSLARITGSEAREDLETVVDGFLDQVLRVRLPVRDVRRVHGAPEVDPHHLPVERAGCVARIAGGPRGCPFPEPSVDFGGGV